VVKDWNWVWDYNTWFHNSDAVDLSTARFK
jgi:hypothetical protein